MRLSSKRSAAGHLAEFPVAIFALFFLFFPLVNLLALATGAATTCLLAHTAVSRAATQEKYGIAREAMTDEAVSFMGTGFAGFARLKPQGGYEGSGCDLYVVSTNYRGQEIVAHGPNKPVPPPIDTSQWIYEYCCQCTFDIGPAMNMSFFPFLKDIPGIGKPLRLTSSAYRVAEYPKGLSEKGNTLQFAGAGKYFQSKVAAPGQLADQLQVTDSGWDYPNMYAQIAQAGQEVVDSTVLKVDARNEDWTDTTLTTAPGQRLWFDFRSEGQWSAGPYDYSAAAIGPGGGLSYDSSGNVIFESFSDSGYCDANGQVGANPVVDPDKPGISFPWASLIGEAGTERFLVGKVKRDFEPASSGRLKVKMADHALLYGDNQGFLTVRIVVTKVK